MFVYCLTVFVHPIILLCLSCPPSLFSSCSPFSSCSSWGAPLMLSCCPFGVVRSQLGLLLTFCPFVFCCPPHVLLWSFCCLRCCPRQGLGLRPLTTQKQFGLCWYRRKKKLATVVGRAAKPCPVFLALSPSCSSVLLLPSCSPSSGVHWPRLPPPCRLFLCCSCSPVGVLPSCCPVVPLALSGHSLSFFCPLGVFVLFSFPHPFVLCCPPHVFLWSFCCPAAVVLFTLLSKARALAAAAHHHNNNSC